MLFRLPVPEWTDDFSVALLATGNYFAHCTEAQNAIVKLIIIFYRSTE